VNTRRHPDVVGESFIFTGGPHGNLTLFSTTSSVTAGDSLSRY
jgi:hypothetical protein